MSTARDRLTAACEGKPDNALAGVVAGDVVAVAETVAQHDETTTALRDGAAACRPAATVYQLAGQVRHLLSKVTA